MPYSLSQSLEERIHTSISSSLSNLSPSDVDDASSYLDCLVLHSPLPTIAETILAYQTMQTYVPHKIRALGLSNTTLPTLQQICTSCSLLPSVVQNRFYPETQWEAPLRKFCKEHGIVFQSFWTYTGNPGLVRSSVVAETAEVLGKLGVVEGERKVLALYGLVLGLEGVTVLDGTTREERMRGDLEGLELLGKWVDGEGKGKWEGLVEDFRKVIREF